MEWLFVLGLIAVVAWWQETRIAALKRRIDELERRAHGAAALPDAAPAAPALTNAAAPEPAEVEEPLLLTEVVPDDELILDTPVPAASNDEAPVVLDAAAAEPAMVEAPAASPLVAPENSEPPAPAPSAPAAARRPLRVTAQLFGVLAMIAALLAPALIDTAQWLSLALTLTVSAIGAVGFALAAAQRWAWVAVTTIVGLYLWFAAAIGADDVRRALAYLSLASLGAVALTLRRPLKDELGARLSWRQLNAQGPSAALSFSSIFLITAWFTVAQAPSTYMAGPALIGVFHAALASYAVRARVVAPAALAVAIGALVFGFVAYQRQRFFFGPIGADFYPTILFAAFAIVVSALTADPHRSGRTLIAVFGASGAAVLTLLAASSRPDWSSIAAWAPLFAGAALLFAAAWSAEQDSAAREADWRIDAWAGASAALLLVGIESAFPTATRTTAHAAAALTCAGVLVWRGWRAMGPAAVIAAALALAQALSSDLIGATLAGDIPLGGALTIMGAAVALLFGASAIAAQRAPRTLTSEALGAAAILVILVGAVLTLRWIGAAASLDGFAEMALRALLLMAAGHAVMARPQQELGRIGRWRAHALIGAGLVYVLWQAINAMNPWWGVDPAAVIGPPLLDTQTLAFAAPAALSFVASARLYDRQRLAGRIYAASGAALGLVWIVLELRRGFHGADMAMNPVGLIEAASYALAALTAALAVALAARMRAAKNKDRPLTRDLATIMDACAWAGLFVALVILLDVRHPWWGAQAAAASDDISTGVAVLAQALAVILTLVLGRALSRSQGRDATRFAAAASAVVFAWSFGHAAIRWLALRGAMDDGGAVSSAEGFAHALWPLAFALAGAAITARAPGRETVRSYLYDLQAIWATAVWPALGFAGLGLWLLFNPWWGFAPSEPVAALTAIPACVAAAGLSALAPRTPHLRWADAFSRAATAAVVAHLFVALTLLVRRMFHAADMAAEHTGDVELWTYSGVWALFGAGVVWLGISRRDAPLRWCGLAVVLAATAKVFLIDMYNLGGAVRVASFIVLVGVLWGARRMTAPGPGDLLTFPSNGRRGKPHGRRQRST